jgi:hypothetical protein
VFEEFAELDLVLGADEFPGGTTIHFHSRAFLGIANGIDHLVS